MSRDTIIIKDEIFGTMEYKHSWIKKEHIKFLEFDCEITIIAKSYNQDKITESQQKMYLNYLNILIKRKDDIIKSLMNYCKSEFNVSLPLKNWLKPNSIVFERDGSWCIYFDSNLAVEEGVALNFNNNELLVGTQDDFL